MNDALLSTQIMELGRALSARGLWLCTAESCTGGLISSALTDVSGSSEWFRGAVVAYANEVKESLLQVPRETLEGHGAVSEPVVLAMAAGVCVTLGASCSVAVSGIAGPTGGSPDKPVGTVWLAWCVDGIVDAELKSFGGSRAEVKAQTVRAAVKGLLERLGG
ncbi:MAG: CinA family protein [Proteobacteria bacterium]|nr:CinA family protein [Pseudomonadota bacterium]